ncbi:MAG: hypothetical protein H7256_13580 [Bdellovibrio sp.]|nr:hypothetical protein [Bdellovibrio sp.]
MESFYRKTYEALSGSNCNSTNRTSAFSCPAAPAALNKKALEQFSETDFFNGLSKFELDRLQCGQNYWKSLSSSENEKTMIQTYESSFKVLNSLKTKMNKLSQMNAALWSTMTRYTNPKDLVLPGDIAKKKEYDDRNKQITELKQVYEAAMAQIPNSDLPAVRDFIEDHAGPRAFSSDIKKITSEEFRKLTNDVYGKLDARKNDINDGVKSGQLSSSLREELAGDGYLIGQLSKQSPDLSAPISKYQCLAQSRKRGKAVVDTAVTVASVVVPVGAVAMAKVARAAFLLRAPKAVGAAANILSRGLGMSAGILSSYTAIDAISNACLKGGTAKISGACEQTPQTIIEQREIGNCIFESTMAAVGGAGAVLSGRIADRTSALSKFVDEMKVDGRLNRRSQDLTMAATLTDAERIASTEGILGRKLSTVERKALIDAHNIGDGFGTYTPAQIAEKRALLKAAGMKNSDVETVLWKGLAGKESASASTTIEDAVKASVSATKLEQEARQALVTLDRKKAELKLKMNQATTDDDRKKIQAQLDAVDQQIAEKNGDLSRGLIAGTDTNQLSFLERRIGSKTLDIERAEEKGTKVAPLLESRAKYLQESAETKAAAKSYDSARKDYELAAQDVEKALSEGGLKTYDDKLAALRILENAGPADHREAYDKLIREIATASKGKPDASSIVFRDPAVSPSVLNQQRDSVWFLAKEYKDQTIRVEAQRERNEMTYGHNWENNKKLVDQFEAMVDKRQKIKSNVEDKLRKDLGSSGASKAQKVLQELGLGI